MKRPKSVAKLSGTLLGRFSYMVFTVSKSIHLETCLLYVTVKANGDLSAER